MMNKEVNSSLSNSKLSQLHSMAELRQAKIKVRRAIRYAEEDFKDEYSAAMDAFSWRDYISLFFTVFDNVQSVGRYLGKGLYTGVVKACRRRMRRDEMMDE